MENLDSEAAKQLLNALVPEAFNENKSPHRPAYAIDKMLKRLEELCKKSSITLNSKNIIV
jgi:hypothetical protein